MAFADENDAHVTDSVLSMVVQRALSYGSGEFMSAYVDRACRETLLNRQASSVAHEQETNVTDARRDDDFGDMSEPIDSWLSSEQN